MRVSDQFNCVFCGGKCFYRYSMEKYDIWQCQDCRHVIEHLPDPITFMKKVLGYLKGDGIFVVQVPNDDSLEYLAYPQSTIRRRVSVICKTNNLSLLRVFWIMISGGMLHGIDPPRHLWAITREGIKRWADDNGINCNIYTHHLGSSAYSPYHKRRKNIIFRMQDFVGQKLMGSIHGGTHLVAVLRHVDGGGGAEP